MSNLRKRATPSSSRKGIRGGFAKPARARGRTQGDELVDVDAYKRNPPTPPWPAWLTERLVRVKHHWRGLPYVASKEYRPTKGRRQSKLNRHARAIGRSRGWI